LAAGLILKRLLLIQLFDTRSKINALLASEAASGWLELHGLCIT